MAKRHYKQWVNSFRWFTTSGGQHIGINDDSGKVVAPKWYKKAMKNPSKIKALCPECGRKLTNGVCRVHGKIR